MLAGAERREVDAFARNFCLSRGYDEEGSAPRAFHDDSFALRKSPLLEQTGNLLGLPPIHAGEELDALEGGDGITRRWAGRRPGLRIARCDRAALEEVEFPILKRPFDVASRAIDLLAPQCELAESHQLEVVERELIDLHRRYLLLEGAPVWKRANCDALASGLAGQHLTGTIEAKMIGDYEAGDHGLTEAPACFDQTLIGTGDRVFREHDSGDIGVKQRLDDNANARPSEQAHTLAIGDGRVGVCGPPYLADGCGYVMRRMDVEHRKVLPGEPCRCAVFVDGRRPDSKGCRQVGDCLRNFFNRLFIAGGDGLDQAARQRNAGWDRETLARGVAKAHGL